MSENGAIQSGAAAEPGSEIPHTLPVLLLTNQVAFPMSVLPVRVTAKPDVQVIDDALMSSRFVALLTRKSGESETRSIDNAYEIGSASRILQMQRVSDGTVNVVIQALHRFKVSGVEQREPYTIVRVTLLQDSTESNEDLAPLATAVKMQMSCLIALSPDIPDAASNVLDNIDDPGFLADLVAANLNIAVEEKQKLLAMTDRKKRLERLAFLLAREVEMMELSDKIRKDVRSSIDKSQREYFLRQQLKAIRQELGESDDARPEVDEYRKNIEALNLKEEVKKEALRELNRLSQMSEASAEYHVIASYLDWIVELPWNISTDDTLDTQHAEAVLNEDHYGLDRVKRRIVE